MALNRNELANGIYFAGLLILVAGLPLSMFLMSVSQLVLLASWIISGNLYEKLKTFLTNPVTLLTGSVFFLHLISPLPRYFGFSNICCISLITSRDNSTFSASFALMQSQL